MPSAELPSSPTSDPPLGDPSPSNLLEAVDKLKFFLATAPSTFPAASSPPPSPDEDRALNRFLLPTGELISCVLWNGLYHITGTDIVRALNFRFLAFGRPVRNTKKFEEGVFSDLRNLKSGTDATLEEPKSEFLELLFKHNCIRTQKKQKVFYWFSVPHDRLFLDALDRDLKREKLGQESTTEAVREPALSFRWNPNKSLFDQFTTATLDPFSPRDDRLGSPPTSAPPLPPDHDFYLHHEQGPRQNLDQRSSQAVVDERRRDDAGGNVFGAFSLFEGSPAYKQRRRPLLRNEGGPYARPSLVTPAVVSAVPQTLLQRPARTTGRRASPTSASEVPYDPRQPLHFALPSPTTLSHSVLPSGPPMMLDSPSGENGSLKTYVCPVFSCGRLFKRLEHLKRHVRTHTSEKPFACSNCGKAFARSDNLAAHVKVHEKAGHHQQTGVELARRTDVEGLDKHPKELGDPAKAHRSISVSSHSKPPHLPHAPRPFVEGEGPVTYPHLLPSPSSRVPDDNPSPPLAPYHRYRSPTPSSHAAKHPPNASLVRHHPAPLVVAESTSQIYRSAAPSSSSALSSFAAHIGTLHSLQQFPKPRYSTSGAHCPSEWQARSAGARGDELATDARVTDRDDQV